MPTDFIAATFALVDTRAAEIFPLTYLYLPLLTAAYSVSSRLNAGLPNKRRVQINAWSTGPSLK